MTELRHDSAVLGARGRAVRRIGAAVVLSLWCSLGDVRGDKPQASAEPPTGKPIGGESDALLECHFYDGKSLVLRRHWAERNVVSRLKPEHPSAAVAARISGDVDVAVRIRGDGSVLKACAVSGPAILRGAAETAAVKWRFRPHRGKLDLVDQIRFTFTIAEPTPQPGDSTKVDGP